MRIDWRREFVRFLPLLGLALTGVGLATWLAVRETDPGAAAGIAIGVGTLFYAGKEAGIPAGIAHGGPPLLVGIFVFMADTAFTFFVYPPIHFTLDRLLVRPGFVGAVLREAQEHAERHQRFVLRYGSAGLFLFMLVPFAFNGPLIGAILGRLVGLRALQIIPTMLAAIGFTTVVWTLMWYIGLSWAETINPRVPMVIAWTVVSLVVAAGIVSVVRAKIHQMRGGAERRAGPDAPEAEEPQDPVVRRT